MKYCIIFIENEEVNLFFFMLILLYYKHLFVILFLILVMITFKIYSQQLSNIKYCNSSHHTTHYILRTYISYNWKLYLLTTYNHFAPSDASGNCQSVLVFLHFTYLWDHTTVVFVDSNVHPCCPHIFKMYSFVALQNYFSVSVFLIQYQ